MTNLPSEGGDQTLPTSEEVQPNAETVREISTNILARVAPVENPSTIEIPTALFARLIAAAFVGPTEMADWHGDSGHTDKFTPLDQEILNDPNTRRLLIEQLEMALESGNIQLSNITSKNPAYNSQLEIALRKIVEDFSYRMKPSTTKGETEPTNFQLLYRSFNPNTQYLIQYLSYLKEFLSTANFSGFGTPQRIRQFKNECEKNGIIIPEQFITGNRNGLRLLAYYISGKPFPREGTGVFDAFLKELCPELYRVTSGDGVSGGRYLNSDFISFLVQEDIKLHGIPNPETTDAKYLSHASSNIPEDINVLHKELA